MLRRTFCQLSHRGFHAAAIARLEKAASAQFNAEASAKQLGVTFSTPNILEQALTHKSYKHGNAPSNDRLVQLGNRALSLFAAEEGTLQAKHLAALEEYVQSRTGSDTLAQRFDALGLEPGLQYDTPKGASTAIKAKAVKAVIGAVYHDQGANAARDFVQKYVLK